MALRSVIGWLAWVAHATRPDLAYRFHALQQRVTTATVETLREVNRVVTLALNDAERSIVHNHIKLVYHGAQESLPSSRSVTPPLQDPSVVASIT